MTSFQAEYDSALAHHRAGRLKDAIDAYSRAVSLQPDAADAHLNLGLVLLYDDRPAEAVEALHRSIALRPQNPDAFNTLGNALRKLARPAEAVAAYTRALELRPLFADAHNNLGGALGTLGRAQEAIAAYRQALAIQPDFVEALYNLATSLQERNNLQEAISLYRRALELRPDFLEAWGNLATALKYAGELDESLECHRRALAIKPDPIVADNLLLAIYFHPGYDARRIKQEHDLWYETYAKPLAASQLPHANAPDPLKRLKIGYVSPDLREHPVGRFMTPLIAHHDHAGFEVFCYSDNRRDDAFTQVLRSHADVWRDVKHLSDEDLAALVRRDGIDVLVDLTMHLEFNRMSTFARKPAPVQVTYLAYVGTTGLETIDYRLSDPYLDPPGIDESVYTERTFRLPRTYWCYPTSPEAPLPNVLPALKGEGVSFGCLNNYAKVTEPTLEMWTRLLGDVPDSTLMLFCPDAGARDRAKARFAADGIDPQRLRFVRQSSLAQYYKLYHFLDIALDPFPYAGGTTSCDALYMGVPVVTRAGQTAVSRGGLSILTNLGLPELITRSADEYVRVAAELARDLPRLAKLRESLRGRMDASPLMDGPRFARDVEAAFRQMWVRWCDDASHGRCRGI